MFHLPSISVKQCGVTSQGGRAKHKIKNIKLSISEGGNGIKQGEFLMTVTVVIALNLW